MQIIVLQIERKTEISVEEESKHNSKPLLVRVKLAETEILDDSDDMSPSET